ncbi:RNA polymerase sigma factor [Clostridium algidicarnis]|uniref:RNA polymerase sigma factor n=1 Tax=Clostridium algidicarnis TaxID=37659 RepID=UPI003FD742E1
MEETKDGDKESFEKLVLKHRKNAVGFAYGILKDIYMAEDIVQESFASIYINRHSYKSKNTFKTFLFAIIRNKCIDFIRKTKNYSAVNLDDISVLSTDLQPQELFQQKEELQHSIEVLNKLNEDYRIAFYLYEVEGFSYKEIAEIMHKSLPQIKITIYRARKKLREFLKEDIGYGN